MSYVKLLLLASTALAVFVPPFAPPFAQEQDQEPESLPLAITSPGEADLTAPRGVLVRGREAYPGYTLFAPLNSRTVLLVDLNGEIVHRWETDSAPAGGVYLLEDGTLLRCGREDEDPHFKGGGIGGRVQKLAPDGTLLWQWNLANEKNQQHHDLEPLPNGNLLVIAWERVSAEEAVQRGRDPEQVGERGLWPDVIYEIRPTPPSGAEIVWEWHAWDHLIQDFDAAKTGFGSVPEHPELLDVNADHRDDLPLTEAQRLEQEEIERQMQALGYAGEDEEEDEAQGSGSDTGGDWLHTNAVDYHPGLDLIALSSPHLCEIWVIDHSTTTAEAASHSGGRFGKGGDVLWRWGKARNYGVDEPQRLFYQHDPSWILSEDAVDVRLLVFNNGGGRPDGSYSSVEELVLPFDSERGFLIEPGSAFGPSEPAWLYKDVGNFFSAFISGCRRLPNGNTLICSGAPGRLFEVTAGGDIVWDYRNPHGGEVTPPEHAGKAPALALFRGSRYGVDHPGVQKLLP